MLNGAVADHAIGLAIAISRCIVQGHAIACAPETRSFDTSWYGTEFAGRCMGIIGLGAIGLEIARRAHHGFGMRILYSNRRRREAAEEARVGAEFCSMDALLREADYVVVACPCTPETTGLLGPSALAQMKRTAFLINIARGAIVDTAALTAALRDGTIAGAALDVTEPEPLPRDHPLLAMPNVIVTPHIGSATLETRARMTDLTLRNLEAGLAGRPLPTPVPGSCDVRPPPSAQ